VTDARRSLDEGLSVLSMTDSWWIIHGFDYFEFYEITTRQQNDIA